MGVPMKAPVPAPILYTGWQGWYLGGSIGAAECPDECFNAALNKTQVGWVVGTGIEHKLSQHWSVFGEFLYYDFAKATAQSTTPDGSNAFVYEFTHEIFQGKLGVNYRF
jgi:opacity protein-like surface antigen